MGTLRPELWVNKDVGGAVRRGRKRRGRRRRGRRRGRRKMMGREEEKAVPQPDGWKIQLPFGRILL